MTFSPLADMSKRVPDVGRSSPRLYAISGVGVHYQYGKNIHSEATNPAREVSANYWIDDDGTIRPNIDEERRAWTSGAPGYPAGALADHRNINVEVSCTGPNTDRISDAALASLGSLIGDIYKRHELGPVRRGASKGVGVHRDWVATACPGDYMMERLPSVIAKAEQYRVSGAGSGSTGDEEMTPAQMKELKSYIDARTRSAAGSAAQIVKASGHWLDIGIGRCGVWGKDLPFLRSAIVSLSWQRRDGAGPKGKSDVAYATGGPSPFAYEIFEEYRAAAREGGRIHGGSVYERKMREREAAKPQSGGAAGGSAAMTAHLDMAREEIGRLGLSDAEVEELFEGVEESAPDHENADASDVAVQEALAGLLTEQE